MLYSKKSKKIILISFLLLLLLLSVQTVSASEQINITYIGYNPADLSDSENYPPCLGVWMDELIDGVTFFNGFNSTIPDNYDISFTYIYGYDAEYNGAQELRDFLAEGGGIDSQDIVIFDMIVTSDMAEINELIKAAKTRSKQSGSSNPDLTLIEINGMANSEVYDIVNDEDLERLFSYKYFTPTKLPDGTWTTSVSELQSLTYLVTSHLIQTYAPDKCKDVTFEKVNYLYVGYDPGDEQRRQSGIFGFNTAKKNLEGSLYSEFFDKIDGVSYGSTPGGTLDIFIMDDYSWASVSNLEANMTAQTIEFSDYDVIVFDGFVNDSMLTSFATAFKEASDSGATLVFSASFTPYDKTIIDPYDGKPIKNGRGFFADVNDIPGANPKESVGRRVFNNYPAGAVLLGNVGTPLFDKGLNATESSRQIHFGFLEVVRLQGTDYTKSISSHHTMMSIFNGYVYHPISGKRFESVEDYMKWHKTSDYYKEDMPYIGIFGFSVYAKQMVELTQEIENRGYNVVAGDGVSVGVFDEMDTQFLDKDGNCYVTCLISIKNWALNYGNQPEGVYQLEKLNVPVIKVVDASGWVSDSPYDGNSGIPEGSFSWMTSSSNLDGMIDFVAYTQENRGWIADRAIGWAELNATPNPAKEIAFMYYNYPPGKEEIGANYLNVMRSLAGDGAKDRVTEGKPSVAIKDPDYKGILRELKSDDYYVDLSHIPLVSKENAKYVFDYTEKNESLLLNEENLVNLIYNQGINVGSYAPGVLDEMVRQRTAYINDDDPKHTAETWWGCELIPVKDYLEWLEHETTPKDKMTSFGVYGNGTMDPKLYDALIKTWGTPKVSGAIPADDSPEAAWGGMIWHDEKGEVNKYAPGMNYIVVPMVKFGNIRIMPEPNRALASDKALDSATYHSGDLPPTHQYVAFYFWINRGTGDSTGTGTTGFVGGDGKWNADAIIHFGTHGTQEWLPGTSIGLKRTQDWGPVLLPDVPNIYPYIVANVGEGLTAEYRGNAVIISHMTPPMIKTRLYDDLIEMETAIRGYQKQNAGSPNEAILSAYREIIMDSLFEMGWQDAFIDQFTSYKQIIVDENLPVDDKGTKRTNVKSVTNNDVKYYLSSNSTAFNVFLEDHLHNFVEAIRENSLSYGTHVYGHFNEEQIAPMVWNMWSRQGLDEVLLDTYFSDTDSIPTNNDIDLSDLFDGFTIDDSELEPVNSNYTEDDILKFVSLVVNNKNPSTTEYVTPTSTELRSMLDAAFPKDAGNAEYQDKVIFFLLGPSGYFTDDKYKGASNTATVTNIKNAWKSTTIDGVSIYDMVKEEYCDFYYYHSVPSGIANKEAGPSTGLAFTATDGTTLSNSLYDAVVLTQLLNSVLGNKDYNSDPYKAIETALNASSMANLGTSRPWYHQEMVYYMLGNDRISYAQSLRDCGPNEMAALSNALNAGYISPSPGNDPVLNAHSIPTGRNFYGVDPSTYSTPAAWKVGKVLGEQLLTDYYNKTGEFPTTVSFMRFGVDYIQDEGTLEACLFYLLGCEPDWLKTGVFKEASPVRYGDSNYDDMFKLTVKNKKGKEIEVYRPRVDVVYNSAGMRDGYGSMLRHIDKAVKAVAKIDDDPAGVKNNIRDNAIDLYSILTGKSKEDVKKLLDEGKLDASTWDLATSRTFAQELGTYEIGTGNLVSASGNLDPNDPESIKKIADLYLAKMAHLYTESNWGGSSEDITKMLQALLGRTDASIFASAGNLYDSLDNDDVFQYFGIMNTVSSMYDRDGNYIPDPEKWKTPQMYIADTSNIHNYKNGDKVLYTASEYIQKDLAARYLNPEWVQGQMEAGYSGAALMAEFIENLYGWSVATNGELIGAETWNKVFELYTSDELSEWLSNSSPYALQSINARMVEAMRTGMWSPDLEGLTDEEIKAVLDKQQSQMDQLVENYVKSVIESGVACCHHTCGNPTFDSFVQGMLQTISPDVLNDEEKQTYLEIVKKATEQPKSSPKESTSSGSGVGMASVVELNTDPNAGDGEEGEDAQTAQNPGVGMDGDVSGTPTDVAGFEMSVSKVASSVRDFIQNPTFSTSSIIAIAFVVIIVGAIFYGSRRKNL